MNKNLVKTVSYLNSVNRRLRKERNEARTQLAMMQDKLSTMMHPTTPETTSTVESTPSETSTEA